MKEVQAPDFMWCRFCLMRPKRSAQDCGTIGEARMHTKCIKTCGTRWLEKDLLVVSYLKYYIAATLGSISSDTKTWKRVIVLGSDKKRKQGHKQNSPNDQISALASYADCLMTSGAIQNGVPTKVFLLLVVLVSWPATPKSASFTSPLLLSRTFAAEKIKILYFSLQFTGIELPTAYICLVCSAGIRTHNCNHQSGTSIPRIKIIQNFFKKIQHKLCERVYLRKSFAECNLNIYEFASSTMTHKTS